MTHKLKLYDETGEVLLVWAHMGEGFRVEVDGAQVWPNRIPRELFPTNESLIGAYEHSIATLEKQLDDALLHRNYTFFEARDAMSSDTFEPWAEMSDDGGWKVHWISEGKWHYWNNICWRSCDEPSHSGLWRKYTGVSLPDTQEKPEPDEPEIETCCFGDALRASREGKRVQVQFLKEWFDATLTLGAWFTQQKNGSGREPFEPFLVKAWRITEEPASESNPLVARGYAEADRIDRLHKDLAANLQQSERKPGNGEPDPLPEHSGGLHDGTCPRCNAEAKRVSGNGHGDATICNGEESE